MHKGRFMSPSLILINPWIYDFAAYDLWSKPLGLLYLAGTLRRSGFKIHLIDCLDIHHPEMQGGLSSSRPVRRNYGTGKFWRKEVPKPPPLKHVQRPYSRYGISRALFVKDMERIKDPAAILVTSLMTYWYPGVKEVIQLAREIHPGIPIILGGLYARLCEGHALRTSGADLVFPGTGLEALPSVVDALHGFGIQGQEAPRSPDSIPYPAFDMLRKIDYISLLTSTGCPYRCRYCASHFLNPHPLRRDPGETIEEILYWHKGYGVRDFAFYDDALLVNWKTHIGLVLEELMRRNLEIRFHTPNALHIREVTGDLAKLLYRSGFRTIRLGLETSDMGLHHDLDRKLAPGEFERAVTNLAKAGYSRRDIGAYVLAGLPGQSVESVRETMEWVGRVGGSPYLAEYSPIPHTPMWEEALAISGYDLASEPLYHNNTLLPCWDKGRRERFSELKERAREIRRG